MQIIHLTNGGDAIVDDQDFHFLNQWKWRKNNQGYAYRTVKKNGKAAKLYMHHALLPLADGMETDHENRNRLDNRRFNLRRVPHWKNCHNRRARQAQSGHRGISKPKGRTKWRAMIYVNRKAISLGNFATIEQALEARHAAERRFGI